jgi:hypothetical protein
LTCNEGNQVEQVFNAETRAPRGPDHKRIRRRNVGPRRRKTAKPPGIIVEVDAVFTPRIAAVEQGERKSAQGMKRMGDLKELPRSYQIRCS